MFKTAVKANHGVASSAVGESLGNKHSSTGVNRINNSGSHRWTNFGREKSK